jgi:predicted RNase H-like nuclease
MSRSRLQRIAEVDHEMQPYGQRTVFEVNPELTFLTLNEERPVRYGKRTEVGQRERRALLERRLPGIERVFDARVPGVSRWQLLDAAADLFACRRIISRAVMRYPADPEWDEQGLRMELIR